MKVKQTFTQSIVSCAVASMLLMALPAWAQHFGAASSTSIFGVNVTWPPTASSCTYLCQVTVSASETPTCITSSESVTFGGNVSVICSIANVSGIQPPGTPVVFFGSGGTVGLSHMGVPFVTPVPFESTIEIAAPDVFLNGSVGQFKGADLVDGNWDFSVTFETIADFFSISLMPTNTTSVTLSAESDNSSLLYLDDTAVFDYGRSVSGVFTNGASMSFSGFMTEENTNTQTGPEIGTISVNLPVHVGQFLASGFLNDLGGEAITVAINYIRSDFISKPTVSVSTTSYQVDVGSSTTITVTIDNPSQYFTVASGSTITLSDGNSSTGSVSFPEGNQQSVGAIGPGDSSVAHMFTVTGNTAGNVQLLATLSGVNWAFPADCNSQTVSAAGSLAQPIVVVQPSGSLQVTMTPPAAVSAGAQWEVDNNGQWQNSGATVNNLPVGTHTVSFGTMTGWTTPGNQNVAIAANQTTEITETYNANPPQLSSVSLSGGLFGFVLNGPARSNCVIEVSSDLLNWTPMSTNSIPAGGSLAITEAFAFAQHRHFYRAVVQ